ESITRATVTGASEAMLETGAEASPALRRAMGDLVQNATYEAAQGFDRAVYDVQNGNAGIAPRSSVLAAVGTSSSWLVALPALLVAANVALVLLLVAALGWALLSL
ncbi:MAG TPA: hypothetical protein VHM70_05875, partial [Polyangiaceae bacterium]|nr:hypothetical protein [Polyangiaceae bacterium]